MAHPLDGCWAKIQRADETIQNLAPELDDFVSAHYNNYRIERSFNPQTGRFVITAFDDGVPDHPLRFSVLIGEAIAHLRSCLDHVIWALAHTRNPGLSDKIGFPIHATAGGFEKSLKSQMLKGLSRRSIGIVDSVQPYRQAIPRRSPLFRLHQLNNIDKHCLLIVTGGAMANPMLGIDPGTTDVSLVLPDASTFGPRPATKYGSEILSFVVKGHNPQTKINVEVSCQVAFEDVDGRFSYVIAGLKEFRDATAQTIRLFQGEF